MQITYLNEQMSLMLQIGARIGKFRTREDELYANKDNEPMYEMSHLIE